MTAQYAMFLRLTRTILDWTLNRRENDRKRADRTEEYFYLRMREKRGIDVQPVSKWERVTELKMTDTIERIVFFFSYTAVINVSEKQSLALYHEASKKRTK